MAFLLLVACGGGSATHVPSPTAKTSACSPARPHEASEFDQTITSGALERTYILHVPLGYDGAEPVPLVLLLHGFAVDGRFMLDYTKLGAVADREGFILVAPNGTGAPQRWNAQGDPSGADDLRFVTDLLAKLDGELCVDQARTFAVGYSNGGAMSVRLACDLPERIHAVGLVSAVYIDCTPLVPMIGFHGTADPLVGFEGADNPPERGGRFPPVREAVAKWAVALGCAAEPDVSRQATQIELSVYNGCTAGDGAVQLYVIEGGGHTWPGADLPIDVLGATTQEINANVLIWQFLAGR